MLCNLTSLTRFTADGARAGLVRAKKRKARSLSIRKRKVLRRIERIRRSPTRAHNERSTRVIAVSSSLRVTSMPQRLLGEHLNVGNIREQ